MKFKKAIIFLLCAIMSLSMLACGNIDAPTNTPPGGGGGGNTEESYTVTFDLGEEAKADGVTVSPATKKVSATLGALPTVSGEYEGYTFGGWYNGSTQYTESSAITANITLTAKWNPVQMYTVTFTLTAEATAAGVKVNPSTKDVAQFQPIGTMPRPTPSKYDGLAFAGWYDNDGGLWTTDRSVTGNVTLTAKFADNSAQEAYEGEIASWAKAGHLYVHYKRYNHVADDETTPPTSGVAAGNPNYNDAIDSNEYSDWGLWAWPKKNPNGRLFNAAWVDVSGAVFDIDLSATYNDCGWDGLKFVSQNITNTFAGAEEIGLQIHQISTRTSGQGFWANDGGDNYLVMSQYKRASGDYHWFISEGRVNTKEGYGSASFADMGEYENPYADDLNHTKNATKISGTDIIADSTADNSGKYPLATLDSFDSVNGYQIFIASFCDSDGDGLGDIPGIISKLDYLKSLNIDLLWLTPFQTSTNYHGYDINDYKSVDSRWGTEANYRELISKAHAKGMKIVMDFVLNHTSLSNEWYIKSQNLVKEQNVEFAGKTYDEVDYRQFYSWITKSQYNKLSTKEKTHWYKDNYDYYYYSSFSSSQPELNFDYQPVRDAILDVCYYWLEQGLDGFRLDAVKHIYMCNEVKGKRGSSGVSYKKEFKTATTDGKNLDNEYEYVSDDDTRFNYDVKRNLNFYREFNYRIKEKKATAYVVGENLDGWDQRTAAFYQGIDSQFDFALYYNIPRGILHATGINGGFSEGLDAIYSRYNRGKSAYTQFNEGYVGGQFTSNHDLPRARDRVNVTSVNETADKFGSFYTNNSIDGEKHIYDETVDKVHKSVTETGTIVESKIDKSTDMLKVYYAALMTLPGVTWLYYGDELGMSGLMQHTLSCKTQSLQTSTTASEPHEDIIYRQPMKWNKATADKYSEATNTSHGNAAFKIGYGDKLCELVGINATDYVPSVAESTESIDKNGAYTFKNGTLIDWVAKLNKMRKEKGITNKATVTVGSSSTNSCEYTVKGTNGSITVKFSTKSLSGTGYNGLSFSGSGLNVLITG